MLKLDLGAGERSPDGFTPLGNINGTQIYPLPYPDGSVDEIRASHVLEHFPHGQIGDVLNDWTRALKPGGQLRVAVPDFGKIAQGYVSGAPINTMGYVMGGQVDEADYHKTIFDEATLKRDLATAGLMLIREWRSELSDDCAALPISLNLGGTKPYHDGLKISAAMSVPRLGFMDMFGAAFEALPALHIPMRRYTGAFWSQCIERVIEETLEQDQPDAVLTIDYDTVFTRSDVAQLIQLMCCYPEADAIAALQSGRGKTEPLFTVQAEGGENRRHMHLGEFAGDLTAVSTAHFGLTLIRADKFASLPRPWFIDVPDENGRWGPGRTDADINFWRQWRAAGNGLFIANRVPVGHLELQVLWPGQDLGVITQPVSEWRKSGKPSEAWK